MITREQSKCPIVLLLCLTFPCTGALISAVVVSYFKKYIGFLITNSTLFVCSTYLTYKLQNNNVEVLNVVIFGAGFAIVVALLVFVQLVYLLVKWCKCQQQYFYSLSKGAVVRLYLGYSLLLMGTMIGTGYFISYIIEEGVKCYSSVDINWIILGILYGLALVLGLICWIYVVCFWGRNFDLFQEEDQKQKQSGKQRVEEQGKEKSSEKGNKVAQHTQIQDFHQHSGQKQNSKLKEGQKSKQQKYSSLNSEQKQKQKKKYFQKQLQKLISAQQPPKQQTNNLKEPLIAEVDSSDQQSDHAAKKRLQRVEFQQFITRQEKKKKKEEEKQQTINRLMEEKENQKNERQRKKREDEEMKNKLMHSALSPDHPDFHKIFQEEKKEEPQSTPEQEEQFYPANFIPSNQKQKKKFQKYKKKLYDKYKGEKRKPGQPRHPQNISGGRSKRLLKKYLEQSKKPNRNQSLLATTPPINSNGLNQHKSQLRHLNSHQYRPDHSFNQMIEQMSENSSSSSSSQKKSKVSGKFAGSSNGDASRMEVPDESRTFEMIPPSRPGPIEQMVEREPETLFFSKEKIKIKNKKPLFEPEQIMNEEPPIEMIIKNMIQRSKQKEERKRSQALLKQSRQRSRYGRKGQKLLDYIRSSFQ